MRKEALFLINKDDVSLSVNLYREYVEIIGELVNQGYTFASSITNPDNTRIERFTHGENDYLINFEREINGDYHLIYLDAEVLTKRLEMLNKARISTSKNGGKIKIINQAQEVVL